MSEFKAAVSGETEAQWRQFMSYLFAQDSAGIVTDGVLKGLVVAQTTSASSSVKIALGAAVVQDSLLNGGSPLISNAEKTLDILGPNPMGGTPRYDIVVFDAATSSIRNIVGTPNASPTDPSVPATAVKLARLRHLASATTVPAAQIDDLRVITGISGAARDALWAAGTGPGGVTDAAFAQAVTFTAGGTERYKITLSWTGMSISVVGGIYEVRILDGATQVGVMRLKPETSGSAVCGGTFVATHIPSAGSVTYVARIVRIAGSGTISVATPVEIIVEQITEL